MDIRRGPAVGFFRFVPACFGTGRSVRPEANHGMIVGCKQCRRRAETEHEAKEEEFHRILVWPRRPAINEETTRTRLQPTNLILQEATEVTEKNVFHRRARRMRWCPLRLIEALRVFAVFCKIQRLARFAPLPPVKTSLKTNPN